jgi:hypothetical protein
VHLGLSARVDGCLATWPWRRGPRGMSGSGWRGPICWASMPGPRKANFIGGSLPDGYVHPWPDPAPEYYCHAGERYKLVGKSDIDWWYYEYDSPCECPPGERGTLPPRWHKLVLVTKDDLNEFH